MQRAGGNPTVNHLRVTNPWLPAAAYSYSRQRAESRSMSRRHAARHSHGALSAAVAVVSFSPFEEEFFRAGDQMSETASFGELDDSYEKPGLWRSLIALLGLR